MRQIILSAIILTFASCSHAQRQASAHELVLPEIPAELTAPADRADYLALHFWDNIDFNDTILMADTPLIEQSFANFISVFPIASPDTHAKAINNLLDRASSSPEAYKKIAKVAETYLYEPESPVYCEEFYIPFLRHQLDTDLLSETEKARPAFQLGQAMKNRVGMKATDFEFTTLKGEQKKLSDFAGETDILLVFFEPDCSHCKEAMALLPFSSDYSELINHGDLTVVAIYSGEDKGMWEAYGSTLPDNWIIGYEPGAVYEEETYVIRELPALYLLDKDLTVKGKNLPVR